MSNNLKWKSTLLAVLLSFSFILILPTFYKDLPKWFKTFFSTEGIKLGLDLQGGMHLIMQVDVDQAVKNQVEKHAKDLKDNLAEKGINIVRKKEGNDYKAVYLLPNKESVPKIKEIINKDFLDFEILEIKEDAKFPQITFKLSKKSEDFIRQHTVDQSLEIIRNRIDQFGVSEPVIVRQGEKDIVIQLPGVKDPQRALNLIGQTAVLEFKVVVDKSGINPLDLIKTAQAEGRLSKDFDSKSLNVALKNVLPKDTVILPMKEKDDETGLEKTTYLFLQERALMTGDTIKTAFVQVGGNFNEPYVAMEFTDSGARQFDKVTADNVGKRLAIVLDNIVRSAPVIRERISGGNAQITGSFTHEEASDLSIVLRAGALPAPLNIIQNITVGPSLGMDSIQKGFLAGLLGGACVLLFMIIYYHFSGFLADIAMFLNLLFLFAVMSALQSTLTLPGIAGIILTIGMGVDSNVLILERMRDEKRLGKTLGSYIDGGYNKAFWTIVDAHITTLITAIALFMFGTGPVKGFAVTLSAGIMINLFTAIFFTRMGYDFMLSKNALKEINFLQIIGDTKIKFMSFYKIAFIFSSVLVIIGLFAFIQIARGKANLGVDFSGGSMIMYKAEKPFNLSDIRAIINQANIDPTLQDVSRENKFIVKIKKNEENIGDIEEKLTDLLNKSVSDNKFSIESKTEIGSSVSKDLRNKALFAIFISLLGILGYLAFRFNISFGAAAAIATFHDVIAILAVLYLFGFEMNLLIVTALLTIAGYSLTDTVVVFDRIREVIRREGNTLPFTEIINKSVNEMLARTILASLTTLITSFGLAIFGGIVIRDFAIAVTVGVLFGTYSSIFVASPIIYMWHRGNVPKIS